MIYMNLTETIIFLPNTLQGGAPGVLDLFPGDDFELVRNETSVTVDLFIDSRVLGPRAHVAVVTFPGGVAITRHAVRP